MSDALSIAVLLGAALGVAMYAVAPWLLARIAGPASAAVVAPAMVYVRIRCARSILLFHRQEGHNQASACVYVAVCMLNTSEPHVSASS